MRTIVAIILLILIIGLGIYEQYYIKSVMEELIDSSNDVISLIQDEDMQGALDRIQETKSWWDEELKMLEVMLPHNILTDISIQIADVEGQIHGDDASQAIGACYVLIGLGEKAPHILGFQLQHIF